MRENVLLSAAAAITLLLVAGCQTNSERAIKLQGQSGKMNRNNDFSYFAVCKAETPGGHAGIWKGQLWREKERAMRDVLEHNKANAGHHATVEHH